MNHIDIALQVACKQTSQEVLETI